MAPPEQDLSALKIDRGGGRRARRRNPWWGRLVWIAVLGGALWFFQRPLRELADRVRLPEVEVARVVRRSPAAAGAVSGAAANGYVIARVRAALSAEAPGRLVEMNVVEGSVVRAGDVVARLDYSEPQAALVRAEAELALAGAARERAERERESAVTDVERARVDQRAAEAEVTELQALAAQVVRDRDRAAGLAEKGVQNAVEHERLVAEVEAAEARVAASQGRLESAQAAIKQAEGVLAVRAAAATEAEAAEAVSRAARDEAAARLEKTYVRAPFDGVVVQKEAEVGEVVSPNSQGGSRARGSVVTMVDLASLEVQAEVPETTLAAVRLDAPARVFLDAYPGEPYAGRIDRIWPTADRQKATVEVRIAFEEPDERLRPEMGVRVVFLDEEPEPAAGESVEEVLLIPTNALVTLAGERGVFVLERDAVRFQALGLGEERGGRVVVESGFAGDELVVLDPPSNLKDGDRVRRTES